MSRNRLYPAELRPYVPPNFDLDAFARCQDFGPKEWAAELWPRYWLRRYLEQEKSLKNEFLNNGTTRIDGVGLLDFNEYDSFLRFKEKPIKSMSQEDVINMFQYATLFDKIDFISIKSMDIFETCAYLIDNNIDPDKRFVSWNEEDGIYRIPIFVDLETPDKILFEHFKTWLNNTREELNVSSPKQYNSIKNLRAWADARVLEYIDVLLWNRRNNASWFGGRNRRYKEIGKIIFPDNENKAYSEQIRTVTADWVDKILTRDSIDLLIRQVVDNNHN